jgi:hypothetical protein
LSNLDPGMVSLEHIQQQLKALTVAQQATFKALADMMIVAEESRLLAEHTLDMVARWPYVKGVKK